MITQGYERIMPGHKIIVDVVTMERLLIVSIDKFELIIFILV